MEGQEDHRTAIARRYFLSRSSLGLGAIALSVLLNENIFSQSLQAGNAVNPLVPKPPHFAPKAKSIIYLFMSGAPSQLDLFEYKPKLTELDGKKISEELIRCERFAFLRGVPQVLASPYKFQRQGQTGVYLFGTGSALERNSE